MTGTISRALFLDRDGVLNEEIGYLSRSEQVRFVAGIFPLCRSARRLGYRIVVVTNQSGIARGLYTIADFERLMTWIRSEFVKQRADLDAVYFCPYHPEHGLGEYRREHEDRKPGPGMLLRAARDLGLHLSESVMVGDRCSDIRAANAAGLRKAFLLTGTETGGCPGTYTEVNGLGEVETWLNESAGEAERAQIDG